MSWARAFFETLDELLCAVLTGSWHTSLSLWFAQNRAAGGAIGCVMCAWLHATLRQRHCTHVLAGERTAGFAALSAAVQLSVLGALLFYGLPFAVWRLAR